MPAKKRITANKDIRMMMAERCICIADVSERAEIYYNDLCVLLRYDLEKELRKKIIVAIESFDKEDDE